MMGASFGLYFKGLTQEEANAMRRQLNEVAAFHGYTATRGATAGQGNAAELLVSIASGEVATVLQGDEERNRLIGWLDGQVQQLEHTDYLLSLALKSLANQLQVAVERERE